MEQLKPSSFIISPNLSEFLNFSKEFPCQKVKFKIASFFDLALYNQNCFLEFGYLFCLLIQLFVSEMSTSSKDLISSLLTSSFIFCICFLSYLVLLFSSYNRKLKTKVSFLICSQMLYDIKPKSNQQNFKFLIISRYVSWSNSGTLQPCLFS